MKKHALKLTPLSGLASEFCRRSCHSFSLAVLCEAISGFAAAERQTSSNRFTSVKKIRPLNTAAKLILHLEGLRKAQLRESYCIIYERLSHKISISDGLLAQGRDGNAAIIHLWAVVPVCQKASGSYSLQ